MPRRPGYESARFIESPSASAIPITERALLGPLAHSAVHFAYAPWRAVANAPGVGVANLAYIPDFLISAPEWYAGHAIRYHQNAFGPTAHATMITGQPQFLEGVGGLTAGQWITGPLLGLQQENDSAEGYYRNG